MSRLPVRNLSVEQVVEKRFNSEKSACIRKYSKLFRFAMKHDVAIVFPKLDVSKLRVFDYSDSSFANNVELFTQLEYIVFLVYKDSQSVHATFRSFTARRVVRSAMASEFISFSNMLDGSVTLSEEFKPIANNYVPLKLL